MKKRFKFDIFKYFGIFAIFIAWLLISMKANNEVVMPSIRSTFSQLFNLLSLSSTYLVLLNSVGGLILIVIGSFLVALILALISLKFESFKNFITPTLSLFKILPVPAVIILLLVQYLQSSIPYILTTMVVIPIVYEGIYGNLFSIDQDIKDEIKMITKPNLKVLINVYLPIIKIGILTTLLQSFGMGLKVKVMTEFIANSPKTIGYQLGYARSILAMDQVFAWTIILVVIVIIIDSILGYLLSQSK